MSPKDTLLTSIVFVLSFQAVLSAEVVYECTSPATSIITTTEVGDTVTLGGNKRFITSFSVGMNAMAGDVGDTDYFYLVFYLPNSPGESPGRVIWQSATISYDVTAQGYMYVAFDVPHVRVPETFIWSVRHTGGSWFTYGGDPTVGSSPPYNWTNLTKENGVSNFRAIIEASDRPDAKLLATKRLSSSSGIGGDDYYLMQFYLNPQWLDSILGATFIGITEWDIGTFPSKPPSYYPEFAETLTNGQDDTIEYRVQSSGSSGPESTFFTKSPGIAGGHPDLYGCIIKDIGLKIDDIDIDHDTPGWTYFDWDVTWEIWGIEKTADINNDGGVDGLDFALLAAAWETQEGETNWDSMCDIAMPSNNVIDAADLAEFCSKWLDGCAIDFAESFETGDFSAHPWQNVGNATCQVVSGEASDGTYSVKTGDIIDNQTSGIQLTLDTSDSDISFYIKVSSEANWDFLRFYIDGVETGSWSGGLPWSQISFPITAGTHTFKWVYKKDGSYTFFDDCAWIDQIVID